MFVIYKQIYNVNKVLVVQITASKKVNKKNCL